MSFVSSLVMPAFDRRLPFEDPANASSTRQDCQRDGVGQHLQMPACRYSHAMITYNVYVGSFDTTCQRQFSMR